jgi:hypothetical protein
MTLVVALALIALRSVPEQQYPADVPPEARIWIADAKQELREMAEEIMQSESEAACVREQLLAQLAEKSVTIEEHHGGFGQLLSLDVTTPPGHDDLLALQFEISIPYGSDSTLYLYRGGQLVYQREENDYDSIGSALGSFQWQISAPDGEGTFLVLTTAISPSPASNWQMLTYTVDRIVPWCDVAVPIDRGTPEIFLGWDDLEIHVEPNRYGLKFAAGDFDSFTRTRVLEYEVDGDRPVRIDPVADLPHGFVREWLFMPADEVMRWSDVERPPGPSGDYASWGPTGQCVDGTWQVRLDVGVGDSDEYYSVYYLVTEDHGTFRMREIRDEPRPGCPEPEE